MEVPEGGKKGAGPQEENKSLKEEVKTLREDLDSTRKGEEPKGSSCLGAPLLSGAPGGEDHHTAPWSSGRVRQEGKGLNFRREGGKAATGNPTGPWRV